MKAPKGIPKTAQFIFGLGASGWFNIILEGINYRIERYSEDGELECSRLFKVNKSSFDINKEYTFTYLSHCKQCVLLQDKIKYIFNLAE